MGCMLCPGVDPTTLNYSRRAKRFSAWAEEQGPSEAASGLRARFTKHAGGPLRIVDIGCGSGRDLVAFAADGHRPVGVEPCAEFVRIARGRGAEVVHAGFEELTRRGRGLLPASFADGADGIFCLASLFHMALTEIPRILRALRALLRPAGVLLTTIPTADRPSSARGTDGRWCTALPLHDHERLLTSAGFELLESDANLHIYNGVWGTCVVRRPVIDDLDGGDARAEARPHQVDEAAAADRLARLRI